MLPEQLFEFTFQNKYDIRGIMPVSGIYGK